MTNICATERGAMELSREAVVLPSREVWMGYRRYGKRAVFWMACSRRDYASAWERMWVTVGERNMEMYCALKVLNRYGGSAEVVTNMRGMWELVEVSDSAYGRVKNYVKEHGWGWLEELRPGITQRQWKRYERYCQDDDAVGKFLTQRQWKLLQGGALGRLGSEVEERIEKKLGVYMEEGKVKQLEMLSLGDEEVERIIGMLGVMKGVVAGRRELDDGVVKAFCEGVREIEVQGVRWLMRMKEVAMEILTLSEGGVTQACGLSWEERWKGIVDGQMDGKEGVAMLGGMMGLVRKCYAEGKLQMIFEGFLDGVHGEMPGMMKVMVWLIKGGYGMILKEEEKRVLGGYCYEVVHDRGPAREWYTHWRVEAGYTLGHGLRQGIFEDKLGARVWEWVKGKEYSSYTKAAEGLGWMFVVKGLLEGGYVDKETEGLAKVIESIGRWHKEYILEKNSVETDFFRVAENQGVATPWVKGYFKDLGGYVEEGRSTVGSVVNWVGGGLRWMWGSQ